MADQSKPADVTGVTDPDERLAIMRAFVQDYLAIVRKHGIGLHRLVAGENVGFVPLSPDELPAYEQVFIDTVGGRAQ